MLVLLPHSTPPRDHAIPWVVCALAAVSAATSGWALTREDAGTVHAWSFDPEAPATLAALAALVLHAGWPQLAVALAFLVGTGRALEWRIGRLATALVYLGGAIAGILVSLELGERPITAAAAGASAVVGAAVMAARARLWLAYWIVSLFGKVHVGTARFVFFWGVAHLAAFGVAGALSKGTFATLGAGFGVGVLAGIVALVPALKPKRVAELERQESQVIGTPINSVFTHRLLPPDPRRTPHDWW